MLKILRNLYNGGVTYNGEQHPLLKNYTMAKCEINTKRAYIYIGFKIM